MRDGGRSRYEGHAILARRRYGAVQIARWVFALRLAREPDRRTREKAVMSAPSPPLTGAPLLEAVPDATVERHQPRYRRVPATVTTRLRCGNQPAARPNTPPLKEM
jgi:hypothetical protein